MNTTTDTTRFLHRRGSVLHALSNDLILERGTKDEMRISKEALFKGESTRFGPRTIEKSMFKSVEKSAFHLFVHRSKIFVWGA
jgi:hypothetical protein